MSKNISNLLVVTNCLKLKHLDLMKATDSAVGVATYWASINLDCTVNTIGRTRRRWDL